MSEQPKKLRTEKQAAQNDALRAAAAALKEAGLPAPVGNVQYFVKAKKEGKAVDQILAEVKARRNTRVANAAAKKAAPNATRKNKPATNNGMKKVRSEKQLAANARMAKMRANFTTHGIKYFGPSMKEYTNEKGKGRENSAIFANLKAKYPAFTVSNTGEKKAVVAKRATVKKNTAVKGSYVCEKCRLVTNTTRKNNVSRNNTSRNNTSRNNTSRNNTPVAYSYNEQGY